MVSKILVNTGSEVRADVFMAKELMISRSAAAKLIDGGAALSDGIALHKSSLIETGRQICVNIPDTKPLELKAENIPLDIVFEDEYLLVVNKPKGMVVHPAPGHYEGTLCSALLYHCKDGLSGINGVMRPGIIHRIDKDTSGLLIVAKNDYAHVRLAEQIKNHTFTREYQAVCYGVFKDDSGVIEKPIGRHPVKRKQMAVTYKNSKYAKTEFYVIRRFKNYTHAGFRLFTGRTHQIRVHCASIGHPVAGDAVYAPGRKAPGLEGQCLHAGKIGFIHPKTGEYMEFVSDLPDYFKNFLLKCEVL